MNYLFEDVQNFLSMGLLNVEMRMVQELGLLQVQRPTVLFVKN